MSIKNTPCPTSRSDVMSCTAYFTASVVRVTINHVYFAATPYTMRAFPGTWPEIRDLPEVTSRLISKLDRELDVAHSRTLLTPICPLPFPCSYMISALVMVD